MTSLKGKRALITGATAGIGYATALKLLEAGCDVLLLGRRTERLTGQSKSWRKQFPHQQVLTAAADLKNHSQVDAALRVHNSWLDGLTVLINNAGLARGADAFQNARFSDWEEMIDTNLTGLLYLTQKTLPFLIKNANSHIVNLGSVAGRWVYPGGAVYCASKFAVRALSEGLRQDLLGKDVRVTNIEPGMVETEFSEVRFNDKTKAKLVYQNMTPLTAEDVADTILWTLTRPAHVNIQELVIYPTDQASPTQVHRK